MSGRGLMLECTMATFDWKERLDGIEKAVSMGYTKAAIARAAGTNGPNLEKILARRSDNSRYVEALDNWLLENVYSRSADSATSIVESGQVLKDSGEVGGRAVAQRAGAAGGRSAENGVRRLSYHLSTDDIMECVLEAKTLGETDLMNSFLELAAHVRGVKQDLDTAVEELDSIDVAVRNLKSKLLAIVQVRQMRGERAKPTIDASPKAKGKELDDFG